MPLKGMRGLVAAAAFVVAAPYAWAFPPYRDTDAETADPWTLEVRLGLLSIERDVGENEYSSPLLRVNFGLPHRVEIVSEAEYLPEHDRLGDAALGFKWVPFLEATSVGVEVLALLPISTEWGAGVESSLLATIRAGEILRTHLNLSGFHDARMTPAESGWKGGAIAELRWGLVRPGLELFAKQVVEAPVQIVGGVGVIVTIGPIDVRTGVHAGLTPEAPDVRASLWVTGAHSFAEPPQG